MAGVRIVVNDIAASKNSGGAFSVLSDFFSDIQLNGENHEWIFLLDEKHFIETENIKIEAFPEIKKSWVKRLWFDLFSGKELINNFEPDLYLSLQNTATLGVKCKQYVYLHQPLPYQKEKNFSFFKIKEIKFACYQKIIGRIFNYLFKKTDAEIIVQTKWMKESIKEKLKNKVHLCAPSVENNYYYNIEQQYDCNTFFFPASNFLYKNHEVIFKALKYIDNKDIKIFLTIEDNDIPNEYKDSRIVCMGKISREKVFSFYKTGTLIFPSYIESFGLPLLEARQAGAPIIAADTSFAREILNNYKNSVFFNKDDAKKLADLMTNISNNKNFFNQQDTNFITKENIISLSDIILQQ